MNIDYGSRIRAVCDHLETVPGDKYNFIWPYLVNGCGCVIAHAIEAGLCPETYRAGMNWLGFNSTDFSKAVGHRGIYSQQAGVSGMLSGEDSKQAAIKNLRAYADKHYPVVTTPVSQHHTGIPSSVLQIFKEPVTA